MSAAVPAPPLEIVAAVAANGVIGREGRLAWHLPDDLKHFKQLTLGHAMIMGRRTFESIGKALPGRRSIVVSTTLTHPPAPGVEITASLDDAIHLAAASRGPAVVVGGAVLYAAAMPRARVMHLTELDAAVEGDTFYPPFDRSAWRLLSEPRRDADDRHATGFWFRTYQRAALPADH